MFYTLSLDEKMGDVEKTTFYDTKFDQSGKAFQHAEFALSKHKKRAICAYIHLHDTENNRYTTITIPNPYQRA